MSAEEIVRRLADGSHACRCVEIIRLGHAPLCLWRLAVEWVASDDARRKAQPHCPACGHSAWAHGISFPGDPPQARCSYADGAPKCPCARSSGDVSCAPPGRCDCGDADSHPGQPKPERAP